MTFYVYIYMLNSGMELQETDTTIGAGHEWQVMA